MGTQTVMASLARKNKRKREEVEEEDADIDEIQNKLFEESDEDGEEEEEEPQTRRRRKRLRTTMPEEHEKFKLKTFFLKPLLRVVETMRDNAVMNFHVTPTGLRLYSSQLGDVVVIVAFLHKKYFQSYQVKLKQGSESFISPLNIPPFLQTLQHFQKPTFGTQALTFNNEPAMIKVVGTAERPGDEYPVVAELACVQDELEEIPVNASSYPVLFRVSTTEFKNCIEVMPADFEMKMDPDAKMLQFRGETDTGTFSAPLRIDASIIEKMKEHEKTLKTLKQRQRSSVLHYHSMFKKVAFQSVLKGEKLSKEITLGFAGFVNGPPFYCQYVVRESTTPEENSTLSVWIAPVVTQNFQEEDEEEECAEVSSEEESE